MRSALRKMGNSTGLIVPKALLAEIGLQTGAELDLVVEDGKLVASPVVRAARVGWDAGAAALAGEQPDEAWTDVGVEGDADLRW